MSSAQPVLQQFAELMAARRQQRREPEWLQAWRDNACSALLASGLPNRRLESWHYSDADIWLQQYGERHALAPITPDTDALQIPRDEPPGDQLLFNHGYLTDEQLDNIDRDKLTLLPLADLSAAEHGELLTWLQERSSSDPLGHLVSALAPESWVLIVRAGTQVSRTVVLSQLSSRPGVQAGQLIIWVQRGAQATLLDDFRALDGCAEELTLSHVLLKLDADSRLTYVRLQRDSASSQHYGVVEGDVGRDALFRAQCLVGSVSAECGDQPHSNRLRNGFYIRLAEPGAEFVARGAFAASDRQHIDYHLTVDHMSDHGRSDVLFQALAGDRSRAVINGRIHIGGGTRGNDGHFTSHNLLLSDTAEIDAKPELEIYADEVACSHGATIGQLDEEQILYLQSRGIERELAITLLMEGFLKSGMLEDLDEELARFLRGHLLASIGGEHL
ncbi:MAG: SufD family Fe-S cluster assembly protein [Spongiibacteraceae bacterium]|jgi:Fe-S cluster assembly protein SufD|nr:SufD family Fe-S cluster assembly protein [Spongiibacteraceae bacterium]